MSASISSRRLDGGAEGGGNGQTLAVSDTVIALAQFEHSSLAFFCRAAASGTVTTNECRSASQSVGRVNDSVTQTRETARRTWSAAGSWRHDGTGMRGVG